MRPASLRSTSCTACSKANLSKPSRLDAELVRRKLAASRTEAKRAIADGKVLVRGVPVTRPAALVSPDAPVTLSRPPAPFVSRGGEKLDGALRRFGIAVAGRRWLDLGASSGGFTDRLLQGGASAVVAVDVGYGQLHWRLRSDERVVVLERTNARTLTRTDLRWPVDGVVGDLSFISLTLVIPAVASVTERDADVVLLVKPQFEVGKQEVPKGGVVRDPELWRSAIATVVDAAAHHGLGLVDAVVSALPGPAGNREFFVHLRRDAPVNPTAIASAVEEIHSDL